MEARQILARLAEHGTPPDAETALRISVGLDQTISRFQEETLPFVKDGGAELQFIYAPYGRGKTHILKTLQEVARSQGFTTAYVDCRADQAPFASLQDTYRVVSGSLLPAAIAMNGSAQRGPEAVIDDAILSIPAAEARERIQALRGNGSLAPDFRNLIVALCMATLAEPQEQSLELRDLRRDLRGILRSDQTLRVRVSDLYRSHPWLPRPLGKLGRRNAAMWMRSLASLPNALGSPGLVILFDETEFVHSQYRAGSKTQQIHLANLRNLVDHLAAGSFRACAIYYAVVEEFLDTARYQLEALSQRIERVLLSRGNHAHNPRAVWVDLDELTLPGPDSVDFFERLAQLITDLGAEAGMGVSSCERILQSLSSEAQRSRKSIRSCEVRDFVKKAASLVIREVPRNV